METSRLKCEVVQAYFGVDKLICLCCTYRYILKKLNIAEKIFVSFQKEKLIFNTRNKIFSTFNSCNFEDSGL